VDDAALLGILGAIVGLLVAGTVGTAGYLYASDYGLQADVEHRDCAVPVVTIKTHAFGIHHDILGLTLDQCGVLNPGDHVTYHVRTKHTTIYGPDGRCQYDSETGFGCGAAHQATGGLL